MINKERLVNEFIEFIKIRSESKSEAKIMQLVADKLKSIGAKVIIDEAGKKVGSDGSNIIAMIDGDKKLPTILLNAHLDTVICEKAPTPIIDGDIIKSDGSTILGADDKSGVAVILEVSRVLKEKNLHHPPIVIVFTICEEIGLLGVKNLDFSCFSAKYGYSLDHGEVTNAINAAPSHNRIYIKIYGKEAHAGEEPEKGISAIEVAAKAIAKLQIGRIDDETTCNVGKIEAGTATNIIPGLAEIAAEVRSHDEKKLNFYTQKMVDAFKEEAGASKKLIDGKEFSAKIESEIVREYKNFYIPEDSEVIQKAINAGKLLGIDIKTKKMGGGSDANIFNEKGIPTVVLGTGMQKVHTKEEFIKISDLLLSANLLLKILT